ncbi:uncharacterized protein At5g50100, chloroplastic isoform X2 [Benincasa hispida]|uniref:uncharacterized protein At5g50100, chloroplastic isoform X2 n=1 Tax=Benincasa hispida TaxID=102211 RepID=UPI001900BCF5|nr:uncharacterized protein At5g50100, chloroplastic isoform X2 [Benincasa hispida]
MAFGGAAATAMTSKFAARITNPIRLSSSQLPKLGLHRTPVLHPQPFSPFPTNQPGLKYQIRAISEAAVDPVSSNKEKGERSLQSWKIKMLYDGDCPLCMREVNMLRERNKQYGTIKFVDISSDDYSPEENQGLDYKTVMGRIHAILADGTVVRDVEAFRKLYEQVDLGWVYAVTKYEPFGRLADAAYSLWARYRLQLTGRPPLEDILAARKKNQEGVCNDSNACKR